VHRDGRGAGRAGVKRRSSVSRSWFGGAHLSTTTADDGAPTAVGHLDSLCLGRTLARVELPRRGKGATLHRSGWRGLSVLYIIFGQAQLKLPPPSIRCTCTSSKSHLTETVLAFGMTGETGDLPSDDPRSDERAAGAGLGRAPHPIWAGLLIAVLAVGLGACDLVPGLEPSEDRPRPGAPDSLQISLLESGWVVTGFSEEVLQMQRMAPLEPRAAKRARARDVLGASGHACTISFYRPDGPRGSGYYHRSAELAYPDSVLEKAGGETVLLRGRVRLRAVPHESKVSARLRCRLPAVEGAERRVQPFFGFGEEQLAAAGFGEADSTASTSQTAGGSRGKIENRKEGGDDCTATVSIGGTVVHSESRDCGEDSGTDLGEPDGPCTDEPCPVPEVVPEEADGGPTDGPDAGDEVNEEKLCNGDPLKDMDIRATGCGENASIEGGRFGCKRGDHKCPDGKEDPDYHTGIDLLNDKGDPVKAAEGGLVFSVHYSNTYGYYVIIRITNDGAGAKYEYHWYTHLKKKSRIKEGKQITAETEVGKTGISGNADDDCSGGPPHLHYEVLKGDSWGEAEAVNPENHLGTKFNEEGNPTSDSCPS